LCVGDTATFSIPAALGATTYTWTGPKGSGLSDGVTTLPPTSGQAPTLTTSSPSVVLTMGDKAGKLKVEVSNGCVTGGNKSANIVLDCPPIRGISAGEEYIQLFPNPAHDRLNVMFNAQSESSYVLRVFDMTGKLVSSTNGTATVGS